RAIWRLPMEPKQGKEDMPMEKSFDRIRQRALRMAKPLWLAGFALAGLMASAQEKPVTAVQSVTAAAIVPKGAAVSTNTVATNNPEADKAWRETFRAIQAPMTPSEWQTNPPTKEQAVAFWVPALSKAADKAKDFY